MKKENKKKSKHNTKKKRYDGTNPIQICCSTFILLLRVCRVTTMLFEKLYLKDGRNIHWHQV